MHPSTDILPRDNCGLLIECCFAGTFSMGTRRAERRSIRSSRRVRQGLLHCTVIFGPFFFCFVSFSIFYHQVLSSLLSCVSTSAFVVALYSSILLSHTCLHYTSLCSRLTNLYHRSFYSLHRFSVSRNVFFHRNFMRRRWRCTRSVSAGWLWLWFCLATRSYIIDPPSPPDERPVQ